MTIILSVYIIIIIMILVVVEVDDGKSVYMKLEKIGRLLATKFHLFSISSSTSKQRSENIKVLTQRSALTKAASRERERESALATRATQKQQQQQRCQRQSRQHECAQNQPMRRTHSHCCSKIARFSSLTLQARNND